MTLLQHHVLSLSLTAVTTFALGLLVFLAEPKKRLNQVFGFYSLVISWWAFTEVFIVSAHNFQTANLFAYLSWPAIIFIAPAFFHTTLLLTSDKNLLSAKILRTVYVFGFVFLILLFCGLVIDAPRPIGHTRYFSKLTPIGISLPVLFVILVNISIWKLWKAYRKESGSRKIELKYLLWGSVIGYIGGTPDWLHSLDIYIPPLTPLGIYGVPLYSIAMTYAVLHHQLFDFNLVIRKSLAYSILITILTISYFGCVYFAEQFFRITLGYSSVWVSLIAFAVMALLFQPLKSAIQRLVDYLVFGVSQEELAKRMERLEAQAMQTEKFKAVSTLAAGMAHEIKNPLTIIQTYAQYLTERHDDPTFIKECQESILSETKRMKNITKDLMSFAKPSDTKRIPVELEELVRSTVLLLAQNLSQQKIGWNVACEPETTTVIQADPDQIRQILINLIQNAADAMPNGGTVSVSTKSTDEHAYIVITDTGCGIPPEILPKIFDPFVTTKPDGNGLGLTMVYSMVQANCGTIQVDSAPGQGTTFTIRFAR